MADSETHGSEVEPECLGASVRLQSASGKQWQVVRSGSSYCSQSQLALTFGLGKDREVAALEVEWPSGTKQRFTKLGVNRFMTIREGAATVEQAK